MKWIVGLSLILSTVCGTPSWGCSDGFKEPKCQYTVESLTLAKATLIELNSLSGQLQDVVQKEIFNVVKIHQNEISASILESLRAESEYRRLLIEKLCDQVLDKASLLAFYLPRTEVLTDKEKVLGVCGRYHGMRGADFDSELRALIDISRELLRYQAYFASKYFNYLERQLKALGETTP